MLSVFLLLILVFHYQGLNHELRKVEKNDFPSPTLTLSITVC